MINCLIVPRDLVYRMDEHGAGEDSADDGAERDGHGGGQPRDRRLGRQAEVRGPEAAQHPGGLSLVDTRQPTD